jgi:Tol biopolymer transport system component
LLKDVTNAQYAPPRKGKLGHVLFVRDGKLMAQPFDAERMTLGEAPVTLAEDVAVSGGGGLGDFSVSPSGVLAYRRGDRGKHELVWYDRTGTQVGAIGDRSGSPRNNVRLSPDGKWAAFTRQGEAFQDVWIADLVGGATSRFTLKGGRTPAWSPDGSYIAFLRQDTIYRKPVRSGGEEVAVWSGPGIMSVNDWSGDGRYLLLTRWDPKAGVAGRGVWLLPEPMADPGKHEPVFLESGIHPQFVPSIGPPRWVSYDGSDGTSAQVFVRTMPGGAPGRWQVSTDGGNGTRWRKDGRELYFTSSGGFMSVDVGSSIAFQRGGGRPLFAVPRAIAIAIGQYGLGYDVSADGQRFLTTSPNPETPSAAINVVLDWQSMLAERP